MYKISSNMQIKLKKSKYSIFSENTNCFKYCNLCLICHALKTIHTSAIFKLFIKPIVRLMSNNTVLTSQL